MSVFSHIWPRNINLCVALALSLLGLHTYCRSSARDAANNTMTQNTNNAATDPHLNLQLSSDRTELANGQCFNLQLTVHNSDRHTVLWHKEWVLEQDGTTPPAPEAFPRSDVELPPGSTTHIVSIRQCYSDLSPGTYRYRIIAAPNSAESPRSNQVVIQVVR
jgi:hypothetical protein